MKTSGHLIYIATEFPTCMKRSIDYAGSRYFLNGMDIYRYSSAVIDYLYAAILSNSNIDLITKASQMLIDSIIDYFPDKMMKTSRSCSSYIHSGTPADCFKPL